MRARLQFLAIALIAAAPALAEEAHEKTKSGLSPDTELILLVLNFAVLVGGLVYLFNKFGSPFLVVRGEKIGQDIVEAARVRKESEARSAEVDRRLASLEADLAKLREESHEEIKAQRREVAEKSAAEMARIQERSEQEIMAAGKLARLELKRFSAEIALALASQKLQARMTPDTQNALVQGFLRDLEPPASNARNN